MTAMVVNRTSILQMSRGDRDAFAAPTQNMGNELLRHEQLGAVYTVVAHQELAAQALFHGMQAVAYRGLGYLGEKRLRISQQNVLHRSVMCDFIPEKLCRDSQRVPCDLDNRPMRSRLASQESLDSDDAFISYQAHLGG